MTFLLSSIAKHHNVGMLGEDIATCYLRCLGYEIRGRNLKCGRRGEIDILAFDPIDEILVFVEVKARSRNSEEYRPEFNLDARKRRALWKSIHAWIAHHDYTGGYRLDLICVAAEKVTDHFREIGA
jgi:putative endonuclease